MMENRKVLSKTISEFYTVADIKKYLKLSQSGAYGLVQSKDFPVSRIGGAIRIPKEAFHAWVEMQTTIPYNLNAFMNAPRRLPNAG